MAGAQGAWGIDVGVSSLKAIKLRRDGDRVTVEAFEVIEHDKFLTEPDVDRDMLIRSTLQKFMAKYAVRREIVFIGVPGSSTFARFVKLPPVETKKIPEIVRFEAIQQIPFPLDQVNWDYHTFQQPDSPDVEVGIFAMKKELVAQVMSNFTAVDMPVQGVQMSPVAVYNAAAYDGMTQDKGTIVIDMGAEHTDLVIMDQGRLWLRTINIGGNHFTDALAKSFKQPFPRAEKLKKEAATSKYQKQIYQAMRPIFADLVAEIQRSIGHYNSSHRDSKLDRIVGMGNPFKLPNLQKYLQQELKMDVIRLENFNQANVEKAAAFSENILSMTAAYGLAVQALGLAPIDTTLLPTEIARKMLWRKKQPWFIGAAALVALGAVGMGVQLWMAESSYAAQANLQDDNRRRLVEATKLMGAWNSVPDTFAPDKAKVESQMGLASSRAVLPQLMTDVYSSLPQSKSKTQPPVIITNFSTDYYGKLSLQTTQLKSNSATPGGLGAPPPTPDMSADPNATTQPIDTRLEGPSDHGFIVTIKGYTSGNNGAIFAYRKALEQMRPIPAPNAVDKPGDAPYYFSAFNYGGGAIAAPGRGAAAAPASMIWGGAAKGPFWEIFVQDITGLKPPADPNNPGAGGMGGGLGAMGGMGGGGQLAVGELPYPMDLAAPRAPGATARNMAGGTYYTFTLYFKVHVK